MFAEKGYVSAEEECVRVSRKVDTRESRRCVEGGRLCVDAGGVCVHRWDTREAGHLGSLERGDRVFLVRLTHGARVSALSQGYTPRAGPECQHL